MPAKEVRGCSVHASHSLSHHHDEHGIAVPVTSIALSPSPGGEPNPPLEVYRTEGPGGDPVVGLPPLRSQWIAEITDCP